jgi:hypothetical protein
MNNTRDSVEDAKNVPREIYERSLDEYRLTSFYETELYKNRWVVFTALFSTSFVLMGFALQKMSETGPNLWHKLACTFALLIYAMGRYHYWWFHRISEKLRDRLVELEKDLGFKTYTLRKERPKVFGIRLHFNWIFRIISLAYIVTTILVWIGLD